MLPEVRSLDLPTGCALQGLLNLSRRLSHQQVTVGKGVAGGEEFLATALSVEETAREIIHVAEPASSLAAGTTNRAGFVTQVGIAQALQVRVVAAANRADSPACSEAGAREDSTASRPKSQPGHRFGRADPLAVGEFGLSDLGQDPAEDPSTAPKAAPVSMVDTMVAAAPLSPAPIAIPRVTSMAVRAAAAPAEVPKLNSASPAPTAMVAPISIAKSVILCLASSTLAANSCNAAATSEAA